MDLHTYLLVASKSLKYHGPERMVYFGTQLEDDQTLISYGLGNEATIHLINRLRGGGSKQKFKFT